MPVPGPIRMHGTLLSFGMRKVGALKVNINFFRHLTNYKSDLLLSHDD